MPTITKTKIAVIILAVALALSLILNVRLLRSDSGADVLWNAKEAYFFISTTTFGYHVKWIGYPLEYGLAMSRYVAPPDDEGVSFLVIHVTPSGVERYVLDLADFRQGGGPSLYTPRDGRIWANWPKLGGLCWWAGDHFQQASQEERRAFNGIAGLTNRDFDAGWHRDLVASEGGRDLTIKVGEEFELLVSERRASGGRGGISADVRYPGGAPTRVFNLDNRVGRVSKGEYLHAFRDPL